MTPNITVDVQLLNLKLRMPESALFKRGINIKNSPKIEEIYN